MDAARRRKVREELLARADSLRAALVDRWGDAPERDPVVGRLPSTMPFPPSADAFVDEFYPHAAGCLVTDGNGRVLLVENDRNDRWETPGGRAEPGETPVETARREAREEAGVEPTIEGLLYTKRLEFDYGFDEMLPVPVASFEGAVAADAALSTDDGDEIRSVRWFPADDLPERLRDRENVLASLQR